MNTSPLLIVDDDLDDQEIFKEAWKELKYPNPLKFFSKAEDVLKYLKDEKIVPFLIISDLHLPKNDGFDLKKKLVEDSDLNYRSIPFVFFSNTASNAQIEKSYDLGSHGFFIKGNNMQEFTNTLKKIVEYWQKSKVPQ